MKVVAFLTAAFVALTSPETAAAGMLSQAQQFAGLHEVKNNKRLRAALGINPARTPWCGHFMGMVARKAGRRPPESYAIARSWLRFGAPVRLSYARPGDVVVVRAGRSYHVGILSELSKSTARVIGGNQSGRVQLSQFSRGQVVAVRR
ncbi:TIGR02594 family protein [Sinorhizobium numidicum]|uniref:TIGR02594 family protein n=1 Tax=Sinorhizobium numidicum TaxID=680248 RepID=A0ABY8CV04_9HYPH|nr:TIGR02594 family protein [Sinorhizobium numidicum]WEX74557.1 TIGR02594 family protein [Sinorhizobium numidicum]WEX80548.1 TIGR02594 family protein [Sinorhizobium numidicum]